MKKLSIINIILALIVILIDINIEYEYYLRAKNFMPESFLSVGIINILIFLMGCLGLIICFILALVLGFKRKSKKVIFVSIVCFVAVIVIQPLDFFPETIDVMTKKLATFSEKDYLDLRDELFLLGQTDNYKIPEDILKQHTIVDNIFPHHNVTLKVHPEKVSITVGSTVFGRKGIYLFKDTEAASYHNKDIEGDFTAFIREVYPCVSAYLEL